MRGALTIAVAVTAVIGAVAVPRLSAHRVQDADGCPHSGAAPGSTAREVTRGTVLCLLNEERARHGLQPLRRNAILEAASQRHSEDMARRHFFAHDTPDGQSPEERMVAAGYSACECLVGENLYWGAGTHAPPVRAMKGWMHSPGHRENVLKPEYTEVGVGVVYDSPFWVGDRRAAIYTTDFGGPLEPAAGRARSARDGDLVALASRAGGR